MAVSRLSTTSGSNPIAPLAPATRILGPVALRDPAGICDSREPPRRRWLQLHVVVVEPLDDGLGRLALPLGPYRQPDELAWIGVGLVAAKPQIDRERAGDGERAVVDGRIELGEHLAHALLDVEPGHRLVVVLE